MLHLRLSPTDPLWNEVACSGQSNFEGLKLPKSLNIRPEEIESHASLCEIDWLAELVENQHIHYYGAGIGLWAVHLAARAKSVVIHDKNTSHTANALHIAEANKRTVLTGTKKAGIAGAKTTVVIDLRREPNISKAFTERPGRIVVFGTLSLNTALALLDAGFTHIPKFTEAAVFEQNTNPPH